MSEWKAGLGADFWGKVCKRFAVDVSFDDPCLFSVLFRLRVFFVCWRGQKRGHMMVAVVVCFVEKSLQPWSTKLRRRDGNVEEVKFMLSGWFLFFVLLG